MEDVPGLLPSLLASMVQKAMATVTLGAAPVAQTVDDERVTGNLEQSLLASRAQGAEVTARPFAI